MTTNEPTKEVWWVLEKDMLIAMMYRAKYGEEPDMLYLELIANANTVEVEDDD